jgi:hypothetical protein
MFFYFAKDRSWYDEEASYLNDMDRRYKEWLRTPEGLASDYNARIGWWWRAKH